MVHQGFVKGDFMIDRVQDLVRNLGARLRSHHDIDLLKIAATLILAEEISKLATSNVGLQQAETDLATALANLSTAITNAVQLIQSGNPQQAQQAADTMEAAANELNTLSSQLAAAGQNPVVNVPQGSVAATGEAPNTGTTGQVVPQQ